MQKEIKDRLLQPVILLLAFLGDGLLSAAVSLLPLDTLNRIATLTWARLVVGLGGLCLILFAYCIYLHRKLKKKPNLKDYEFSQDPGYCISKETHEFYCSKCLDDGVARRLSFHPQYGLICRGCKEPYVAPNDLNSAFLQATIDEKRTS